MPERYTPKRLFMMVPNFLLATFFQKRGELLDVDWPKIAEENVEYIFDAWQRSAAEGRRDAERTFRLIWELANPKGLKTIVEEGHYWKVDLKTWPDELKKPHAKVLWVYLNHEHIFRSASRLNRADRLNGRYWRHRTDLPAKKPDTSHSTRDLVAADLSAYFWKNQGRGEHCKIDVYLRNGTIHYFFCYPANYVDAPLLYTETGDTEQPSQKPAFEVIFAYHEDAGELEVFVEGDKTVLRDLQEIFYRLVLNEKLPEAGRRPGYNLTPLLNRNLEFPTNQEDKISGVRVRLLRLSVARPGFGRITLESDERKKRGDVYDLVDSYLNQGRLASAAVFVSQVEIEVTFETKDGEKPVRFRLTHPDGCTLGDEPEHLTVKAYLGSWGLIAEG
jgi:hypothetical protein